MRKEQKNWPFLIELRVTLSGWCVEMHYATVLGKVSLFLLAVKGTLKRMSSSIIIFTTFTLTIVHLVHPPKFCISIVFKVS